MLTNTLAFELGKYHVRVNAIAPGLVRTPLTEQYYDSDALWEAMEANIALGRVGKPIDIANVALFLASDLADWVTGATWRVDGGWNPPSLSSWEEQIPTG